MRKCDKITQIQTENKTIQHSVVLFLLLLFDVKWLLSGLRLSYETNYKSFPKLDYWSKSQQIAAVNFYTNTVVFFDILCMYVRILWYNCWFVYRYFCAEAEEAGRAEFNVATPTDTTVIYSVR